MLSVLRNRTYRRLFAAQAVALVGTGLATVALSLLAYDIAGAGAPAVLGTALAIKMVAYVAIAPVIGALAGRIPRRTLMVAMDLTRAGVALALPFVTEVWQIHTLIFLLQAASAAFTPTFQATLPEVLPAERDYTQAVSMSRLAYDLESLFSPALAAALLTVVSSNWLFAAAPGGWSWAGLLAAWAAIGAACSTVLTPGGRLIRRATADADLPAAFAAQFSLSHGCWLLTYPLAGWLATGAGLPLTAVVLGAAALAGATAAAAIWPAAGSPVPAASRTNLREASRPASRSR